MERRRLPRGNPGASSHPGLSREIRWSAATDAGLRSGEKIPLFGGDGHFQFFHH